MSNESNCLCHNCGCATRIAESAPAAQNCKCTPSCDCAEVCLRTPDARCSDACYCV